MALVVIAVLLVVAVLLVRVIRRDTAIQDCVASGRRNCAPIDAGTAR